MDVRIDRLYGFVPVQADGVCLGGRPFYFRARHQGMQMHISLKPRPDLADKESRWHWVIDTPDEEQWVLRETFTVHTGCTPPLMCRAFIHWAVARFALEVLKDDTTAWGDWDENGNDVTDYGETT